MKYFGFACVSALSVSILIPASSEAATFTVDATTPIGSFLDTGINLDPTKTYDFSVVNPATLWSAGSDEPSSRESDANGITTFYGQLSQFNLTANFGTLVGEIGDTFFVIGTGPTLLTGLSGELQVGYWDSYYGDNSGSQTLSITVPSVPLPASAPLFGCTVLALGFVGARRRLGSKVG